MRKVTATIEIDTISAARAGFDHAHALLANLYNAAPTVDEKMRLERISQEIIMALVKMDLSIEITA